jgi:DNA-binding HxlR family transcriptional regulator
MGKGMGRKYEQYCPVAYAMDIVGERWTILILRELMYGPRRFTDILDGVPGLRRSLLAARLRKLKQEGIIRNFPLPAPMRGQAYEFIDSGLGLRVHSAIWQLMYGSMDLLEWPPPEDKFINPMTAVFYTYHVFDPLRVAWETRLLGQIQLSDRFYFQAKVEHKTLELTTLRLAQPVFWVRTTPLTWTAIVKAELDLDDAIEAGEISILYGGWHEVHWFLVPFLPAGKSKVFLKD